MKYRPLFKDSVYQNLKELRIPNVKGYYGWLVKTPGVAVYGLGRTAKDAVKDAVSWYDGSKSELLNKIRKGDIEVVPCTKKAYDHVELMGSDGLWNLACKGDHVDYSDTYGGA